MGKEVSLAEALAACTPRQRYVIIERLKGRTQADIGADTGTSRQSVQIVERHGLAALGLRDSLDSIVLQPERQAAREVLLSRQDDTYQGRRVSQNKRLYLAQEQRQRAYDYAVDMAVDGLGSWSEAIALI